MTETEVREKETGNCHSASFQGAEGATSQQMWATLEAGKESKEDILWESLQRKAALPCPHLDLNPEKLIADFRPTDSRRINCCCFKPLNLC